MTTRPGGLVEQDLRYRRGKRVCHLARITRADGEELFLTDHDRALTFEGEMYEPVVLAELSADRREAALRSGDQEARGVIDGSIVTITDVAGNRYRGAMVRQVMTDWERPWCVIARHRKWIRSLNWTGSAWVGTLEGRAQVLQRPAGGPLSGTWATTCVYILGDSRTCKKDIGIGTGFSGAGAAVGTIVKQRNTVRFDTATWPGSFTDNYFRDGSFRWVWGAADDTGTITGNSTSTTLTDNTKVWAVDEHVGKYARFLTGAGAGVEASSWAIISANTSDTLTFGAAGNGQAMPVYTTGKAYDICPEATNFGVLSPIVRYVHSTRECEFLLPTPFPIAVGDSGIWRVGCDGLRTTCRDKFGNLDNHGGDPFAPSAQQILEPPEER